MKVIIGEWKSKFKKMHFLNKMCLIYSLIIMIPILILECFVLISSSNFIREQQTLEVKETIERNFQDIQNQMGQCEKLLLYLSSNTMLKEFLAADDSEYMKLLQLSKNVGPLIYNSVLSTQYFSKIQIYSEKHFGISYDLFKNNAEVRSARWYQDTEKNNKTLWWYEEGDFFITRCIRDSVTEKELGVVRIDLTDEFLGKSFNMFSQMPISVWLLDNGVGFYHYTNTEDIDNTGYVDTLDMKYSKWQVKYSVSTDYFSALFHPRIIISLVIVISLLGLAWVLINYSTKSLLKYLYRIIDGVKKVRDDNFEIEIDESSGDEIGELARSINQMLGKIRMLIDEVYKSELNRKSLELNLLRSKINPHFLYNNLSAINWIAIEKGEKQIYEITTQLATFYRTALNRGVNIDKLRVETENIKAYIKLQLLAHENSFYVEYDIDETILDQRIPIFIMQPLVENAIEHGTDTLRGERGRINIQIFSENGFLIIKIKDNGKELYKKIGCSIMGREKFGYGVSNVDERVKLLCGESSGVIIQACDMGTTSEIYLKNSILREAKS